MFNRVVVSPHGEVLEWVSGLRVWLSSDPWASGVQSRFDGFGSTLDQAYVHACFMARFCFGEHGECAA